MILDSTRGLAANAPFHIFWLHFCQGFWHFERRIISSGYFDARIVSGLDAPVAKNSPVLPLNRQIAVRC